MPSIMIWDDSLSQGLELELVGDEDELRVECTFRLWHVDDTALATSLRSGKQPRGVRRASDGLQLFLDGTTTLRLDDLTRGAQRLSAVATFQSTAANFAPVGREFHLRVQRHVFVPQVRVELVVDGNVFLPRTPSVPGHSELTLRFWVSDDALLAFAESLDEVAVKFGATSLLATRQRAVPTLAPGAAEASKRRGRSAQVDQSTLHEAEAADELSGRHFYWEEFEESLRNNDNQRQEEEEWERLNEDWVQSHVRERRRRGATASGGAEPDAENEDAAKEDDSEVGDAALVEDTFAELPDVTETVPPYMRLPELPLPSEEAEALTALRDAKKQLAEEPKESVERQDAQTARGSRHKPHLDERTGLARPATFDKKTLGLPSSGGDAEHEQGGAPLERQGSIAVPVVAESEENDSTTSPTGSKESTPSQPSTHTTPQGVPTADALKQPKTESKLPSPDDSPAGPVSSPSSSQRELSFPEETTRARETSDQASTKENVQHEQEQRPTEIPSPDARTSPLPSTIAQPTDPSTASDSDSAASQKAPETHLQ